MDTKDVLDRVGQVGIIPAIRSSDAAKSLRAAEAICQGGIPVIEVSMAIPGSLRVLEAIANVHGNSILVGAGTVVTPDDVLRVESAGANFIVTPGFSVDTVEKAVQLRVAIFVGALTPTEVQVASASGANAVKLFPCYAMGGPRYVKSLRGQYPNVVLIASGGVGLDNCSEYIRCGAWAIGVGGEIADAESLAAGAHRVFTVRAKRLCEAVREARKLLPANHVQTREGAVQPGLRKQLVGYHL